MAPVMVYWAVLAIGLSQEQEPTSSLTTTQLVERLGDPNFRVREQAGLELARHGEAALPALRAARHHPNAELRTRASVLAARIGADTLLKPRRVSLNLDDVPLKDALKQLTEASGYRIEVAGNHEDQRVTVTLRDATFWEALDRIALETGSIYHWNHSEPGQLIVYAGQESYTPYVHHNGPFRLALRSMSASRTIQLSHLPRDGRAPGPNPETIGIQLNVFAEARLPLLQAGPAELLEATDEFGRSLLPPAETNEPITSFYGGYQHLGNEKDSHATLHRRVRSSRTLKQLRGRIPVVLLSERREDGVIRDLSKFTKGQVEGRSAVIHAERKKTEDDSFVLAMSIAMPELEGGFVWLNEETLRSRLKAFDADGNEYDIVASELSMGAGGLLATVSLVVPEGKKLGPPDRLVWYRWIQVERMVTFEFRDVPLP